MMMEALPNKCLQIKWDQFLMNELLWTIYLYVLISMAEISEADVAACAHIQSSPFGFTVHDKID